MYALLILQELLDCMISFTIVITNFGVGDFPDYSVNIISNVTTPSEILLSPMH